MTAQPSHGSADYYEEKNASSIDLPDGASAEFEMRRRASEAKSMSSVKKGPRGKTIRAGDVKYEDMGDFFTEVGSSAGLALSKH